MAIKKSIRTRNRYILFDYISELPKQADELQEELKEPLLLGDKKWQ